MSALDAKRDADRVGRELHAAELRSRDVIFVPRVGKRLVVQSEDGRCFLDYPRLPRVTGSKAAAHASELVPADVKKYLGWVEPRGTYMVVHVRPADERSNVFRSVPVTAASVRRHAANAELVDIYTEMTAIESRTGGRPIREHRNDIRRRLDGLATDVATLPDEPETRQLRIDIGAAKALAALPETSSADGDARLERLIGAIQNYDDDV